ncbi:DUF3280 domain-containing protein [Rhodoblastus sp.]|uniref:DUF3280 domain-containing protein n=1 Tax=Rhodoblastus sp. TaxID=1962975 RepID=UPI003F954C87
MKKLFSALLFAVLAALAPLGLRAEPARTAAVFDVVFINSSPQPTTPEETARIAKTTAALKQALDQSGLYRAIDLAPIAKDIDAVRDVTDCNGCEVALAKKAGARVAVVAWVQKVSNLILNMNIRIVDARTGATLKGGSVDIRGNDERSWDRGLKYLLEEHVFAPPR